MGMFEIPTKPATEQPELVAPKVSLPTASPKPVLPKATASATLSTEAIKEQLDATPDEPTVDELVDNILLDNEEWAIAPSMSISEKIAIIDKQMQKEGIPMDRLRTGLQDVMTCIKAAGDDIMELEPDDMATVVQGYILTADTEVQRIVTNQKKATVKKKKATKAKDAKGALAAAQNINVDEVDL